MMTNAERERLYALIQECSEVQKEATKALIHGWDDWSPFDKTETTNRVALAKEVGDLDGIIQKMIELRDISVDVVTRSSESKWERFLKWSRNQDGSRLQS